MTLCSRKNEIRSITERNLTQEKPTLFAVIATKTVDIVFNKMIDKIKEYN